MKCKYIRYTGHGEPFKHPHILEMLKYTKENLDIPVNLTTNGTMLTKDASLFLLETGINVIDISIDAYKEETYLAIRGADKLKQTAENVRELISLNKENNFDTKVIVSFIQQPLNSAETDDFKIYWTTEGADYVVIRALHSAAGEKCDVFQNDLTSATTEKRRPCLYPWERLILNADGYLGFCPADWKYKSQIGNFKDVSIKQAWTGEHMRKTRKFHLENTFAELELCGNCPDWKETNWPNSGRSYSKLMQDLTANAHGDN